jgi:ABC-type transporter Mla subunit MlaD
METRPPTVTRILIAVAFALSCFGLLLFLWIAFGGPLPLKPEGYRIEVPFTEATQLAEESDVRISGVSVGKVKRIDLDDSNNAVATLELDSRYAPIPADTRATLRQKTLLGETYVELSPGSEESDTLPEGEALPAAQVSESVQLDEIFRAFDSRTRAAFQTWMQSAAAALRGRGDDLSVALASLDGFAAEADRVLRVLDSQRLAVRGLVRDGGQVFGALSERRGQLSGLIRNAAEVFETTARRNADLRRTFTVLPTFLRESQTTLARLDRFAADTDPLITQLRPAARELSPTLTAAGDLAVELSGFFPGLREVTDRAPRGLGALRDLLDDDLPPVLERLDPFLTELTPILTGLGDYRREVAAFFANTAAATNAINDEGLGPRAYLRTLAPLGPEVFNTWPSRPVSNRTNPYVAPGGYANLASGLASFETAQCSSGIDSILDAAVAESEDLLARFPFAEDPEAEAADLVERIREFGFVGTDRASQVPAPGCNKQAPFESIGGSTPETTDYQHVRRLP